MLFTTALLWTHVDMICHGQSTVESLGVRRMHEREQRVLKRLHSWWDFRCDPSLVLSLCSAVMNPL